MNFRSEKILSLETWAQVFYVKLQQLGALEHFWLQEGPLTLTAGSWWNETWTLQVKLKDKSRTHSLGYAKDQIR